jgi:hypothetical protein
MKYILHILKAAFPLNYVRILNNSLLWFLSYYAAKHPRTFDGQLVHIRSAGPNVLVGKAMKLDKVWGEVVLVKDFAAKK